MQPESKLVGAISHYQRLSQSVYQRYSEPIVTIVPHVSEKVLGMVL